MRLKYLLAYNNPNDYLLNIAHIAIWSISESGLGLIAGSLATLRPLLKHIPFLNSASTGPIMTKSSKRGSKPHHHPSHPMHSFSQHRTHIEGGDSDWDRLSDSESQQHIVPKSRTVHGSREITVTTEFSQKSGLRLDDDLRTLDRFDKD